MIDELKEIIEYAFYNMLKLDDTINSPSDIYDLILMIDDIDEMGELNKDTFYESKRSMLFDNMCCSMLPKPTNLKEQIKYLDICELLNYIDEFITKDLEFGKEYDVKKYRYVSLDGISEISVKKMTKLGINADSCAEITFSGDSVLDSTAALNINLSIAKRDWSNFDQSNDYSYNDPSKIIVYYDGVVISGKAF